MNIGFRPTVAPAKPQLRVEAHLLDFNGNLYGEELEVEIGWKLRDERKFASATELREQIARDIAQVRVQAYNRLDFCFQPDNIRISLPNRAVLAIDLHAITIMLEFRGNGG